MQGYQKIIGNCVANAKVLTEAIKAIGRFRILSKDVGVPVVAFSLLDNSEHDEFEIADGLRRYGWTVPAYTMAPDAQQVTLLRVVVREDFSRSLADRLVTDIKRVLETLDSRPPKLIRAVTEAVQQEHMEHKSALPTTPKEVKATSAFKDHMTTGPKKPQHRRHSLDKKNTLHKTNGVC